MVFSRTLRACAGGGELSSGIGFSLSGDARRPVVSLICCEFVSHTCSGLLLPPTKDGLQHCGEGCDGRLVQVS